MRRLLVLVAIACLGPAAAIGGAIIPAYADTGAAGSPATSTPTAAQIIATAEQYIGYPYAYIGDDPTTGFSCIGFIHFIFAQNGMYVPEELSQAYASAPHVDQKDLRPGDLVFFKDTLWDGISHVDLYVGNGKMIGADSSTTGVQWDTLSDAYWQEHYLGATRPLSDPSGTPVDPSATPAPSSGPSLAPPSGPSLNIKAGTAMAPKHSVSLYSGPGYNYMAIDTALPSNVLTVVQTQGLWVNVSYDGGAQYGWIRGQDLAVSAAPASQPGAAATPAAGSTTAHVASATRHSSSGASLAVAGSGTPLYSGPGYSYMLLSQLGGGTQVTVLGAQNGWTHIKLPDGTRGWVSGASLGAGSGASSGQAPMQQIKGFHATASRHVVVSVDVLFVRNGPSYKARILRRVHAGDRLRVLVARSGWDYVALRDNSRGWVNTLYVS